MASESNNEKENFLYPRSKYYGKFSPQNLIFNANLQEFANRVIYLCGLETNGKLSSQETYQQIKELWQQLKQSQKALLNENGAEDK
jgi:hypothetical protein